MVDVASQNDTRGVTLDEVGITDLEMPIKVRDKQQGWQHTIGTFNVTVELPHNMKGTHMSRLVEAVYEFKESINQAGLLKMGEYLTKKMGLEFPIYKIEVSFPYYVERYSPVSQLPNLMVYTGQFMVTNGCFSLGVKVPIQSVCPCAKEECANGNSHVQRGVIDMVVYPKRDTWVWLEDLIEVAEGAGSSPVFDRLKRPDEKTLVCQAFSNPKFVEDITRDCVVTLSKRVDIARATVSCKNFESIHNSNCIAKTEASFA